MPEGCHRTLTLRAAMAPPIVRSVATATNNQTTAGQNKTNAGIQRASLPECFHCHCIFTMLGVSSYQTSRGGSSFVGELHRGSTTSVSALSAATLTFGYFEAPPRHSSGKTLYLPTSVSVYFTLRLGLHVLAQQSLVYSS